MSSFRLEQDASTTQNHWVVAGLDPVSATLIGTIRIAAPHATDSAS